MADAPVCRFCGHPIESSPVIVDDHESETSTYYHQECPKRAPFEEEMVVKVPKGVYFHITERGRLT